MRFVFVQNQQLLRCDLVASCSPSTGVALAGTPIRWFLGDETTEILTPPPELLGDCNYRHSGGPILQIHAGTANSKARDPHSRLKRRCTFSSGQLRFDETRL